MSIWSDLGNCECLSWSNLTDTCSTGCGLLTQETGTELLLESGIGISLETPSTGCTVYDLHILTESSIPLSAEKCGFLSQG